MVYKNFLTVKDLSLKGERVFLLVDLNSEIKNSKPQMSGRIKEHARTISLLKNMIGNRSSSVPMGLWSGRCPRLSAMQSWAGVLGMNFGRIRPGPTICLNPAGYYLGNASTPLMS